MAVVYKYTVYLFSILILGSHMRVDRTDIVILVFLSNQLMFKLHLAKLYLHFPTFLSFSDT